MEKSPINQQNLKIDVIKDETKVSLGHLFDNKEKELNNRIDNFILKLEFLEKNGVALNKEQIINGVRESAYIKDREVFISHLLKVLEPIITIQAAQPEIKEILERENEKVQRDEILSEDGNLKLSEVLYSGINGEHKNEAEIHLAPATEFIKEKGIGVFKNEIENGLKKLATIIKSDNNIEKVSAVSWIVAKNPALLESLGFTIIGEISEEEKKQENYIGGNRPIARASMKREDFLVRYDTN